jgi:hypothetical protein
MRLRIAQDDAADEVLSSDPFALLMVSEGPMP